jgi:hypothetical protein
MLRGEEQLDRLMSEYREAIEVPEPTAEFMPRLWAKIEARRPFPAMWSWATGSLVAASLLIGVYLGVAAAERRHDQVVGSSYVETLAAADNQPLLASGDWR